MSGDQAIICFYVISGFLITLILNEKYRARRLFYVNRALRIFPAYFVALAIAVVCLPWAALPPSYTPLQNVGVAYDSGSAAGLLYFILTNAGLFGTELGRYFAFLASDGSLLVSANMRESLNAGAIPFQQLNLVPQAWTLSIELQFYLLAPFIVILRPALLSLLTCVGLFGVMSFRDALKRSGVELDISSISIFQLFYFLLGALAYHAYKEWQKSTIAEPCKRQIGLLCFFVALALVFLAYPLEKSGSIHYNFVYVLFALLVPFIFHWSQNNPLDAAIGQYSYPIYLFHFSFSRIAIQNTGEGLWAEATLLSTLIFSYLYLRFVDRFIEDKRRIIAKKAQIA